MAAERRPYQVIDTESGQVYLVRAALNPAQALRAVTRNRYRIGACSAARVLQLVDDAAVKRVDANDTDEAEE